MVQQARSQQAARYFSSLINNIIHVTCSFFKSTTDTSLYYYLHFILRYIIVFSMQNYFKNLSCILMCMLSCCSRPRCPLRSVSDNLFGRDDRLSLTEESSVIDFDRLNAQFALIKETGVMACVTYMWAMACVAYTWSHGLYIYIGYIWSYGNMVCEVYMLNQICDLCDLHVNPWFVWLTCEVMTCYGLLMNP